ncbi:MAG: 50S ribosomal protein L9 [Alphaproteobacteria bacterium]|nr:50S ribosomal protein L9 [Alphaproteobacteria bacterium]
MDVILLERVEKLGHLGQVVKVKPGFARNFLLPQKKALRATKENMAYFESRRSQIEADNLERKGEAESIGTKLDGLNVVLIRTAGDTGQLYGSVTTRDIAAEVTNSGFKIERRQVQLDKPIKEIGVLNLKVALHPEVSVTIKLNVARSPEEAEIQAKTGRANIVASGQEGRAEALAAEAAAPADGAAVEAPAAEADQPKKAKSSKKDKAAATMAAEADAEGDAPKKKGKKAKGKDAE